MVICRFCRLGGGHSPELEKSLESSKAFNAKSLNACVASSVLRLIAAGRVSPVSS